MNLLQLEFFMVQEYTQSSERSSDILQPGQAVVVNWCVRVVNMAQYLFEQQPFQLPGSDDVLVILFQGCKKMEEQEYEIFLSVYAFEIFFFFECKPLSYGIFQLKYCSGAVLNAESSFSLSLHIYVSFVLQKKCPCGN